MTHGVLAPQSSLFASRETVNGSRGGETPTPWVRPADWLPITAPVRADKRMVGLHAVSESGTNFVRIRARGAWRVDWGDGAGWTNVADNDVVEKNLVWGDYSSSTLTSDGFRQAVITVEAQSGQNLTMLYLNERPVGVTSTSYGSGWLDVAIGSSSPLELRPTGFSTGVFHPLLERFLCDATLTSNATGFTSSFALREVELDLSSVTNTSSMFQSCYALQSVPLFDLASVTDTTNMFYGCSSLQSVPLFDLASVTNTSAMFQNCSSLQSVPLFDLASVTNTTNMFYRCSSLQSVPLFDLSSVTNTTNMFNGCSSLQSVPLFDLSSVTNTSGMFQNCSSLQSVPLLNTAAGTIFTNMFQGCSSLQSVPLLNTAAGTNFTNMFQYCSSLQSVPLLNTAAGTNFTNMFQGCSSLQWSDVTGLKYAVSYGGLNLSAAALDNIYTNLGTAAGSQTITVTGNWGTAGDDPTIATAKGWTVAA